ncbi:MAG: RagB/SusD family nutrient uptake outer membrane protein [Bacteroidales bacterium]|nr:RagB/SusD family nutrient uptake outer membrane protein [Bacteroidales bacterium]
MNSIFKKIAVVSVAALALASCTLEETPFGVYSNKTYFLTEADAESALMYAYIPINYIEYAQRFSFYFGDGLTDEVGLYPYGEAEVTDWDVKPTAETLTYHFKTIYVALGRTNTVLECVPDMKIAEDKKAKIMGEAYFLRAFNHFTLVKTWGSVPLRTKSVNSIDDTYQKKAPIKDIYDLIISDLEKAESMLSINKLQGRVDKVGAEALLSRVYLYLASYKATGSPGYDWVEDADEMYEKAVYWADKVIYGQSTYGLEPRLENVYSVFCQNTTPEHIFITAMDREGIGNEGVYTQMPFLFMIQYPDDIIYVSESLIPETDPETGKVKVMKMMDGKPAWQTVQVDYKWRERTYADNDLRKQLFVTTVYTADGDVFRTFDPENINSTDLYTAKFFFPFCRKYSDPISKNIKSGANMYLIRYAEVLLNYAEAAGPTEKGYECVNAVRARAGVEPLPAGLSVAEFREQVWQERNRELSFEAHCLFDLRRMNRVNHDYITREVPKEENAYFLPFPQREVDLNP